MRRRLLGMLALLAGACCLPGCEGDSEYTTEYACYFVFDTTIHNTSIINNALNPLSPGIFVMVSTTLQGSVRYVNAELNDGKTSETVAVTTAKETRLTYKLGAYNGLIIGYGTLTGGELYAFDRQCPNCMKAYNLYKYPLSWTNNGAYVSCKTCGRVYDLNNGGYIVEGDAGVKLSRYQASYNGSALVVHN